MRIQIIEDAGRVPKMRYFSRTLFRGVRGYVKEGKDAVVLARRTLAVLLPVWALTEVCCLPERLHGSSTR
jgi:hypothetical protein